MLNMDWSQFYARNMKTAKEALESLKDLFELKILSKNVQWYKRLVKAKSGSDAKVEENVRNLKLVAGLTKSLNDTLKKSLVMLWNGTRDPFFSRYSRKKDWQKVKAGEDARVRNHDDVLEAIDNKTDAGHGDDSKMAIVKGEDGSQDQNQKKKKKRKKKKKQKMTSESNKEAEVKCAQVNDDITRRSSGGVAGSGILCSSVSKDSKEDCPENQCEDFAEDSESNPVGDVKKDSAVELEVHSVAESLEVDSIDSMTFTSPKVSEGMSPTFSSEFAFSIGSRSRSSWWVDSGASQHFSWDKDDFLSYTSFENQVKVNLADNTHVLAHGSGQVKLMLYDVNQPVGVILNNVLYVPKIQNKLFSVSSASEEGGTLVFDKDGVTLKKNGKSRRIAHKRNKLYHLSCEPEDHEESCCLAEQEKISLWHERFGHLNFGDLKKLQDDGMVKGMNVSKINESHESVCHGCALGKSKRLPFPKKSNHRSSKVLDLIHSDVCGPFHVPSLGGSRYFVTFTDDYSRYVTVNILKTKDEVIERFKEFLEYAETHHNSKVKKFRSDGGGEYISSRFKEVCKSRGIAVDGSIPYSPQQNGVSERFNRTLVEMARSMIYHANIPQKFWAEAISTAAYLRNRCPTSSFKGETPHERWFGVKPDVDHIRVFGCMVYVHIPDEKRRKLDPKAVKGIFVGYPQGKKGYKIYIPESKKFVASRDVTFMEKSFSTQSLAGQEPFSTSSTFDTFPTFDNTFDKSEQPTKMINLEFEDDDDLTLDTSQNDNGTRIAHEQNDVSLEEEKNDDAVIIEMQDNVHTTTDGMLADTMADEIHGKRQRRPPDFYGERASVAMIGADPKTFKQAMMLESTEHWKKAMIKEFSALTQHETWELVDLPSGANLVGCKWVYKTKRKANGEIDRYKARLVAQGYSQEEGIDYNEVFAPVAKYKSIRTVLAIANQLDLEVHQMDVVSAFLNGDLKEDIYMKQPEGFTSAKFPNKVCKLKKSLYGLKQSARCWNQKIHEFMVSSNYIQSTADPCIYYRVQDVDGKKITMIVAVYVDDTIIMSNDTKTLLAEKRRISERFEMDDRGELHHILGMEVKRDRKNRKMMICQRTYLNDVLDRFGMQNCNPVSTPMEAGKVFTELAENEEPVDIKQYQAAIGSLNYAAIATRPDISTAVGKLSQYMRNPSKDHWAGVKRVLRYIKGTVDHGLTFTFADSFVLHGFSDADWAGCVDSRKSTSGYAFFLGNALISWASKKQSIVALSSTEAEYVALCGATQETVWLRNLLQDVGFSQKEPTCIAEDNQGAMCLAKNPKDHTRTKHIDIKYHYTRQIIEEKKLRLRYVPTGKMVADTLTKGLPRVKFAEFCSEMGIRPCM